MGQPIVIAHRGASGHVPEHTLAAYALAVFQGADFIEPDLVSTRDGALIARHDNRLELTTDVAKRPEFAEMYASKEVNGRTQHGWFSEDFDLEQIKRLRAVERLPDLRPANCRFDGQFEVPTFDEVIELARSLGRLTGRCIGVYPETKSPSHFASLGLALEVPLVASCHRVGWDSPESPVFLQSFEVGNLQQLAQLTRLPRVQLLDAQGQPEDFRRRGQATSYRQMSGEHGLDGIATYAQVIGPDKRLMGWSSSGIDAGLQAGAVLVERARQRGLAVHPYTFRRENAFLPASLRRADASGAVVPGGSGDLEAELAAFLALGIDGFFVDHPEVGRAAVDRLSDSAILPKDSRW